MNVRREVHLGSTFTAEQFERAYDGFRALYNVTPGNVRAAPDVLARYRDVFAPNGSLAHAHSLRLHFRGVRIVAAVLEPGTVVFEGEVDEVKMGDW